jgi:hypothetical protein
MYLIKLVLFKGNIMPSIQEKYFSDDRGPDLRLNPSGRRHFVVSEMWDIHHEITRLLSLGFKNTQIAKRLGVSPVMVSNVKNSPVVKDQLAILRGVRDAETIDVAIEIREFAPTCLTLLKDIVDGNIDASTPLKAHTARDLLDRAGFPAIKRIESVSAQLTSKDIEDIKNRAFGNKEQVVEGEYTDGE